MKIHWRTELPHWALLILMFLLAAAAWGTAPDRLPVHWNLAGQPDRWSGRFEGLLAVPFGALALYLLLLLLPRLDPGRANYATFASSYASLRLLVLLFFAGLEVTLALASRGRPVNVAVIAPLMLGGLLVLIGNLMGKLRPNWFVGIRTPWTLSSKASWTRTHRVGGWLLIASGLLVMSCAVFRRPAYQIGVAIVCGAFVVYLIIHSYVVWKHDPDKTPPAGTLPAEP
jgi:immunity protein, SdpI family